MVGLQLLRNLIILVAALAAMAIVTATERTRDVRPMHLMERLIERDDFVRQERAQTNLEHEIVVAVKQLNIDVLKEELAARSSPKSEKYQQWMTFDQISDLTANHEATEAIHQWLDAAGATVTWTSPQKDFIKATGSVGLWEELLSTNFYRYEDQAFGKSVSHIRAPHYSIDNHMKEHIFAVFNTCQVYPKIRKSVSFKDMETSESSSSKKPYLRTDAVSRSVGAPHAGMGKHTQIEGDVNVALLNKVYNIPTNIGNENINQSVFETANEGMSQDDLKVFQKYYGLTEQEAKSVGGMQLTQQQCANGRCFEGNLDIQYIMGISQRTSSIYWYVAQDTSDPFLQFALDLSDEPYPPSVNSFSWGGIEAQTSIYSLTSFDNAALKLSAMGVTLLVASGDNGVINYGCAIDPDRPISAYNNACNAESSNLYTPWEGENTWEGHGYWSGYPSGCPYVTNVGATMGLNKLEEETACQSNNGGVITTGGGFSVWNYAPIWQEHHINTYFDQLDDAPAPGYNRRGRGYPDVSFLGVQYPIVVGGGLQRVFGTSASCPVFAAMISLINSRRLEMNLGPVGFLNPTLYDSHLDDPSLFNDVTEGDNKCCGSQDPEAAYCCKSGFEATDGWDPVTGLGSVSFHNLERMFVPETAAPTESPTGPTANPTAAPSAITEFSFTSVQKLENATYTPDMANEDDTAYTVIKLALESCVTSLATVEVIEIVADTAISNNSTSQSLKAAQSVRSFTAQNDADALSITYTVTANSRLMGYALIDTAYAALVQNLTQAANLGLLQQQISSRAREYNEPALESSVPDTLTVGTMTVETPEPTTEPTASPTTTSAPTEPLVGLMSDDEVELGLLMGLLILVACCCCCGCAAGIFMYNRNKTNSSLMANQERPMARM